jgi:HSP20 family protein
MLWTELGRSGRGFDPWGDLELPWSLRGPLSAPRFQAAEFPLVNVWTNTDGAILTTEIPGVAPESVEISVAGKTVTLRGSREPKARRGETTITGRRDGRGSSARPSSCLSTLRRVQYRPRSAKACCR